MGVTFTARQAFGIEHLHLPLLPMHRVTCGTCGSRSRWYLRGFGTWLIEHSKTHPGCFDITED